MKAVVNDVILAEADENELVKIEGNWYFPPASITAGALEPSPTPYTCPWKGECQYFSTNAGDTQVRDVAWSYPHPYPGAAERVGADFSDYVAFSRDVSVTP